MARFINLLPACVVFTFDRRSPESRLVSNFTSLLLHSAQKVTVFRCMRREESVVFCFWPGLRWEVHAAQQILKTRVAAQKVEEGINFQTGKPSSTLPVSFLQPGKRLLSVPEASIGHG